jgi:ParB family chromosome partitioning protein
MTTTVQIQSEYRDLPLDWLVISPTNPRKTFDKDAMQELAASIRENGVLQPLLVRPRAERSFEIVFGERRFRGAAMAEKETGAACIREMTDAQVLEAQLVENLQRRDVHPLEEARGMLDERKIAVLIRQHCMNKTKDGEATAKLLSAFLPKAEESRLGRILVESVILLSMHNQADAAKTLRDAAQVYKVDVDAISATVKQEFAAKEKGKASKKATAKSAPKPTKKAAA